MDKLLKYLPFLSGLLIFLGVLKLSIFYSYFNIEIISYLSLSEILVAFLNDMNTVVIVVVIGLFHLQISEEFVEWIGEDVYDFIVLKYRKYYRIGFGFSTVVMTILLVQEWINLELWSIYIVVFCGAQFVHFLFIQRNREELEEIIAEYSAPKFVKLLLTMILAMIIPLIALKEIRDVEKKENRTSVVLKNGEKIDNNSNIYLGKVGKYHLFTEGRKTSMIIKDSDVEVILISEP